MAINLTLTARAKENPYLSHVKPNIMYISVFFLGTVESSSIIQCNEDHFAQAAKHILIRKYFCHAIYLLDVLMGGSKGVWETGGPGKTQAALGVLEILIQYPLKKQVDLVGPFASRWMFVWPSNLRNI